MEKPKYLAIKIEFGKIIKGKRGELHMDIIGRLGLEIEEVYGRGYVDKNGYYQKC